MFRINSICRHACGVAALLLAIPVLAESSARGQSSVEDLVGQMLLAAGLEGERLIVERRAVSAEIHALADSLGTGKANYRRARRLHEHLHRKYLHEYDPNADGLHRILRSGRYNCQAATFFMGLVAREMGMGVQVLESPGHLKLQLVLSRRTVEVETTTSTGFDVDPHHARLPPGPFRLDESSRRLGQPPAWDDGYWRVTLEQSVGFAWLNAAWRALEEGDPLRAAGYVLNVRTYLPDLDERADGVRRLFARAFSLAYDAGRFEDAHRIAMIDIGIFPDSVHSQDRVIAAALRLVGLLCDGDDPLAAELLLSEIEARAPITATNLRRRTSPAVVAAAVRLQDWELAREAARRFAAAEPDWREVSRLMAWIDERSLHDPMLAPEGECLDGVAGIERSF